MNDDVVEKNTDTKKNITIEKDENATFTKLLKMFNIVIAAITIAFGVYCYFGFRPNASDLLDLTDPSVFILPGYVALSGLIILAVETETKLIHRNMSFLLNYLGRGFFNVYVAVLCLAMVKYSLIQVKGRSRWFVRGSSIYFSSITRIHRTMLHLCSTVLLCQITSWRETEKRADAESTGGTDQFYRLMIIYILRWNRATRSHPNNSP